MATPVPLIVSGLLQSRTTMRDDLASLEQLIEKKRNLFRTSHLDGSMVEVLQMSVENSDLPSLNFATRNVLVSYSDTSKGSWRDV